MRPLIGIPCYAGIHEGTHRPIYCNNRTYTRAVEAAGGVAILIPIVDDVSVLEVLLDRVDGLLFPGGKDLQPALYGERSRSELGAVDPREDEMELVLARWAIERDIPTLGICRGMQLLNVALGGSLYQDIDAQVSGSFIDHSKEGHPRDEISHNIHVQPGSQMERVLGTSEVRVNSLHHQSVKQPGKGVIISGRSEDGIAELLEVPGRCFLMAVQGHPEEIYTKEKVWFRVFTAFISACTDYAAHKDLAVVSILPMTA